MLNPSEWGFEGAQRGVVPASTDLNQMFDLTLGFFFFPKAGDATH